MPRFINMRFQHITNPLHVYCRLIDVGMSETFSKKIGIIYEKYLHRYLKREKKGEWSFLKKIFW